MNDTAPRPVVGNAASGATPTTGEPAPLASGPRPQLAAWTDSPWFWLAAFAYVGLVWLAAFGPKYGRRQEAVERRFEARREIARRGASGAPHDLPPGGAGGLLDDDASAVREGQNVGAPEGHEIGAQQGDYVDAEEPPPHKLLVSLDPLVFVLAVVLEFAMANLLRPCFARHSSPETASGSVEKPT